MPIKHQAASYRNRNGKRFTCWQDCCEGDTKAHAAELVKGLKAQGLDAFYEKHPEGYCRVFVEDRQTFGGFR